MAIPETCSDFVEHPHLVESKIYSASGEFKGVRVMGCYSCQEAHASEAQGTTVIAKALQKLGIPVDVHQTGGFTMCVYIKTGEESYIYANDEGFSIYEDEECQGLDHYVWGKGEKTAQAKAKKIEKVLKVKNLQARELV
jgi:hypothetical protein